MLKRPTFPSESDANKGRPREQKMSKNRKQKARSTYANSHASIESRPNFNAQIGGFTYTARREDDFDAAVFTDSSNTTTMSVLVGQSSLRLSGRQARTLQRLLNKHFTGCSDAAEIPGIS